MNGSGTYWDPLEPDSWAKILGLVSFAGLYFIWFRNQPEGNFYDDDEPESENN